MNMGELLYLRNVVKLVCLHCDREIEDRREAFSCSVNQLVQFSHVKAPPAQLLYGLLHVTPSHLISFLIVCSRRYLLHFWLASNCRCLYYIMYGTETMRGENYVQTMSIWQWNVHRQSNPFLMLLKGKHILFWLVLTKVKPCNKESNTRYTWKSPTMLIWNERRVWVCRAWGGLWL